MAIAKPSRRLLHHAPLSFVRKAQKGSHRPITASLSLTSMIDFLVVSVVFLLITFSTSSEGATNVKVPAGVNALEMIDAPMVMVANGQIIVDGAGAGSTRIVEETKRVQRLDDLFNNLKAKRELWKQVHPDRPFPGVVVLQIDQDTPSLVVKSVFQTSANAGYPNVSFMVRKADR